MRAGKPPRREGRNVGPGERDGRPKRWVRYNYCVLRSRSDRKRAGTAVQRGDENGSGSRQDGARDGEVEETAGVIGSCLQLYGARIHVSGSVEGESARRGACSVKFSEASGGRGPFTKQREVDIAAGPGAWYGVYGGSLVP